MNLPCGPDGQTRPCVSNGIYLVRDGGDRLAIMFKLGLGMARTEVNLQVIGTSQERAAEVLREIRGLAQERALFRGPGDQLRARGVRPGDGQHAADLPDPAFGGRAQVVLPDELLAGIERQVAGIARHSGRLLASGQHLKRGVLLHGPPGTGKTHTVRYLLGRLPEVTVIAISGQALGQIGEACSVARTLQPAVIVVEDVDLIAEERTARPRRAPAALPAAERDGGAELGRRRHVPADHQPGRPARARARRPARAGRPRRRAAAARRRRATGAAAALPGEPGARRRRPRPGHRADRGSDRAVLARAAAQGGAPRRRGGQRGSGTRTRPSGSPGRS